MEGRASQEGRSSFCKIILRGQPTDFLGIPPQFVKHMSEEASKGVSLKGPSGRHERVKVFEDGKDMYLGHGWEKFARDNSLGNNEFLVFNYNGATRFHVQIFDPNGCERINIWSTSHESMSRPRDKHEVDPAPMKKKKKKKDGAKRADSPLPVSVPVPFTSDLPYFWVQMGVNQVERVFMLAVPRWFSEAHLSVGKTEITLRNEQDKSWKVTSKKGNLWEGWRAFARDNKLKKGDVCVFELVAYNIMQVHVFPSDCQSSIYMLSC